MPIKKCTADGKDGWKWGDDGKCYTGPDAKEKAAEQGRAIKANAFLVNSSEALPEVLTTNLTGYQIRLTKFEGRDHIVVPVVMLTEGVHAGSGGPLYYPAEEIAKFPAAWNGRPVPVLHPVDDDGFPVSCNSPDVLESRNVGHVFNTRFSKGKLIAQLWLSVEKLGKVDDQLLQRLNAKEPIEVSTGLFLSVDNQSGEWNGEEYVGVAREFRPDHLALLPIGTGACSLKDGCGIRTNSSPLDFQGMWQRLVALAAPSFGQISNLIQSKLRENNGPVGSVIEANGVYHWLEEVWPEYFVYTKEASGKTEYFKQEYKVNKDGTEVVFTTDPVPVKLERKYTEITKNEGGNDVDKKEKIKFLTDNGCQCSAEQLEVLEDAILDNMLKTVQNQLAVNKELKDQLAANQIAAKELEDKVKALETAKPTDNQTPPKTLEELLALASPEMQGVLGRAVARDRQLKTDLVEKLATNQKVYSKEELEQKPLEELEKLAALAAPKGDYTLAGGRAPAPTANKEEPMVAPTFNFAK
jgi:hypothetical protein